MTPPASTARLRVGLYMFTPMIGGAEMYLKHLLWSLDRDRYDVTLFCEPWPEFTDFLELSACPPVHVRLVNVLESTGHVRTRDATADEGTRHPGVRRVIAGLRVLHRRLPLPILRIPGRLAAVLARWVLLPVNLIRLLSAFRRDPVDVLHITNGGYPGAQSAQLAALAARFAGCRRTVMTICNVPMSRRFPRTLERLMDRLVRNEVDRIVVPSDAIGRGMIDLRGFTPSQIEKIYFGASDPETHFDGSERSVRYARSANGAIALGMVASFLSHKGHRYMIEAMARLSPDFPQLSLTLIGGGPTKAEMQRLARVRGLEQRVRFPGFCTLSDTVAQMRHFDIIVHPSDAEAMPYVILYAMGFGKPVVASTVGGIPDLIVQGETGLMVAPGDIAALTEAVRSLLTDRRRSSEMGRAGRRRYERLFTVERMIERHQDLYDSLATIDLRVAV